MPTTSIKLTAELKKRVAKMAKQAGNSPHAFMLKAIERQTEQAEKRAAFVAEADAALKELLDTGLAYDAKEVHASLRARLQGKTVPPLKPIQWRK